jgi:hypothetical protein
VSKGFLKHLEPKEEDDNNERTSRDNPMEFQDVFLKEHMTP